MGFWSRCRARSGPCCVRRPTSPKAALGLTVGPLSEGMFNVRFRRDSLASTSVPTWVFLTLIELGNTDQARGIEHGVVDDDAG